MMLRARLLLADLVGVCVEGASIGVPAYLLYGVQYGLLKEHADIQLPGTEVLQLVGKLRQPVLLALLLFSAIYALWQHRRLGALRRKSRAGESNVEEVYALARTLPRDSLWVCTALWTLCGLFAAGWLVAHGMPRSEILPLLWLFSLNPLLATSVRSLVYDRLLWGVPWRSLPGGPDPLRRFASGYGAELARGALLTAALAFLCTVAFTVSVPFDLVQIQRAERLLPPLLLVLLYTGYRYGRASCRPIGAYLRAALSAERVVPEELAAAAYRAAQAVPYKLGAAMVGAAVTAAAVLLGLFYFRYGLPGESVALILGVAIAVTTATALYAVIWHRATLRPLLGELQRRAPLPPDEVPAPLWLTGKMLGGFGLLITCACALSLLWSFVQYRTLTTHHIERLAEDRLDTLLADLYRDLGAAAPGAPLPPLSQEEVAERLLRLVAQSGISQECLVYYLPDRRSDTVVLGHPPGVEALPVPPSALSHLRRRSTGHLDLPGLRLTGEFARIQRSSGPLLGVLAVLYPNYLHPGFRGPEAESAAPLRGQLPALVFFFVVLLLVSGGIVVIAAVDLSRPVRYLERRAAAMAEGDLLLPVVQTAVETDEVGQLTFAFEQMRRALSDKLRSSTQLNLRLEAEVARRTAELSRRNEEVSEALGKLQRTRDSLLRTEKLATMGRIAAAVTMEINNPVNVMSTVPDPISEELDELLRLGREQPLPRQRLAASLRELREMVDVLLRGAQRAKEIVQATRVYLRSGADPPVLFDLNQVADEVLHLFADLPRYGVTVRREYEEGLQALAGRGGVGQLLSSWLARVTPRLRDAQRRSGAAELVVRTRRLRGPDGACSCEVSIRDNGPLIDQAQALLTGVAEGTLGPQPVPISAQARSEAGPAGNQTVLTVVLPAGGS